MPNPAIESLLRRLGRLRARVRRLTALSGLSHVVAWTAAALLAWFLADWLLDLPVAVRRFIRLGLLDRPEGLPIALWAALFLLAVLGLYVAVRRRRSVAAVFAFAVAGVPGVIAWVVGRRLVAPLRVPLSDDTLALTVEGRFARLEDRVAAALDFDREIAAPTRGESTAMMARVVEEAAHEAEGLEFASVASGGRAWREAGIAALAGAALVVTLLAMPATAALWARRSLSLEDVRWPQATTVLAVLMDSAGVVSEKDPAAPYVAALGQSLTVLARADGKVPGSVEILDRVTGSGGPTRPLARTMRAVSGRPGFFEHEFRDVRGDFTFTLRGGDDRDEVPSYAVVVRVPPRVTSLHCDLTFPAYLGMPVRRVEGGNLSVPEGTRVAVAFASDAPVAKAEAFVDEVAVDLARDGDTFRFELTAQKSVRWRLRIVTPDGRENDAASDSFDLTVEPDTPPRPEWVWPRGPVETTVRGRVALFAQTRDDHGVASLALEILVAGAAQPVRVPLEERTAERADGANDRPYGADAILSYVPVEVLGLVGGDGKPLVAPTRLQMRVVATDTKGQEASGPWTAADVLRPDELERGLASQRARVKGEFDGLRVDARALRDTTAALVTAGTEIGDAERQVLRDVQFRQGKVRGDAERSARTVAGIFATYAYARLGPDVPTDRILGILERRHRATFTRASDVKGPGAPAEGADEAEVFPWSLLREVVTARRERLIFDTGVIDKMIAALEAVVEVADPLAPAAQDAAAAAARGGAAEVAALLEAQDRLLRGLDAALTAMAEWQSLSELTLFLRRVIEEQEALDRDIRDMKKGPR
ncbi:MAG TPA: hypothetical protein VND21_11965 [Planctomycetota bacterium]|nr:hypothetical protein [Planctomycetota bacterium]